MASTSPSPTKTGFVSDVILSESLIPVSLASLKSTDTIVFKSIVKAPVIILAFPAVSLAVIE